MKAPPLGEQQSFRVFFYLHTHAPRPATRRGRKKTYASTYGACIWMNHERAVRTVRQRTVRRARQALASCADAVRVHRRRRRYPAHRFAAGADQRTHAAIGQSNRRHPSSAGVSAASSKQTALASFPPDGENCVSLRCFSSPKRKRFAGLRFGRGTAKRTHQFSLRRLY